MRDWPSVSVIVPVLNEAAHIDACLQALLKQTFPAANREIIVVDNGSTDDTRARVARYPVTLAQALVRGPARARNAGIRQARGDFLAFLDGDCIPAPDWLASLLAGWTDPSVGFFAGRIENSPPSGLVDRYMAFRQVICQAELLAQPIPAAAAGNLAVRRAALTRSGGFDDALRWGEDTDLTWRILAAGEFDFRYQPGAVAVHRFSAGPVRLAVRSYHEGLGVAAFRRKHADHFNPQFLSPVRYGWVCCRTAAGLLRYPWLVRAGWAAGRPWGEALAYPALDKLRSISLLSGICRGLAGNPTATSAAGSVSRLDAPDAGGSEPESALVQDIEREPLLRDGPGELTARVRRDLREICLAVLAELPTATLLLTGSLSVNEGRWCNEAGAAVCRSDYDLVVVARSWRLLQPQTIWQRLAPRLRRLDPAAALDVSFLWAPLVWRGWTTTGGRVIAGDPAVAVCLEAMTAPRAAGAIWRSFKHLAEAMVTPERCSVWIGKALLEAAQARLLHDCRGSRRAEWVGLLGTDHIRARIQPFAPELGADGIALVNRAADLAADRPADPFGLPDAAPALRVLRQVRQVLPPPRGLRHTLLEAGRLFRPHRVRNPRPPSLSARLDQLDALITACLDSRGEPADRPPPLDGGSPARGPTPDNRFRDTFRALQELGDFQPHKFFLPAPGQGRDQAGRP